MNVAQLETINTTFKQKLHAVRDTFNKDDEDNHPLVSDVNRRINMLLNDSLMMEAGNSFTFSERTLLVRLNLMNALSMLTLNDECSGKAKVIIEAIAETPIDILSTIHPRHQSLKKNVLH